jgi:hypothetical protein
MGSFQSRTIMAVETDQETSVIDWNRSCGQTCYGTENNWLYLQEMISPAISH